MFCKECGQKFASENATVCLNCGVRKGNGVNYCDNCGAPKKSLNQDVCLTCGKDFKKISFGTNSKKTKIVALLLWIFLGGFGGHYFYVGKTGKAILYICLSICGFLTFGITTIVVGIMLIVDLVKILTDKFEDSNGNLITQWN